MESREPVHLDTEHFVLERRELEAVLESGIFGMSSNAAKLLRYVCERHFSHTAEGITEYDVAVHALGRRSDFEAQRDSIVRVEAHRVRKRLQEYYEHEGPSRPIKIVLSRGQYAPQFVTSGVAASPAAPEMPEELTAAPPIPRGRRWGWQTSAILLVAATGAALVLGYLPGRRGDPARQPQGAVATGGDSVRILAGMASGEYIDRFGTTWSSDAYFSGGAAAAVRYYSLAFAGDPAIYQHARSGEYFAYDIPLRPGVYEMRLLFAESAEVAIQGSVGEGARSFHVTANGVQILPPIDGHHMRELDVVADAGGSNTADVKVFKDISPGADGKLHLRFAGRNNRALLNGIEIVPGVNGRMRTLRWRAGETPYTDQEGNLWLADRYFQGGRFSRFHAVVGRTADPGLYESERFGSFQYSIPVPAGSSYTVRVYFAENYFGGWAAPAWPPRLFNVYANHSPLLRDFDLSREAGGAVTALCKTFRGIKPNSFDKIVLSFEPSTEFAIVNAISVEDEGK
jgi:hypothetical protein